MKIFFITIFIIIIAAVGIALFSPVAVPSQTSPISLTFDPGGVFVTTTTIPMSLASTTVSFEVTSASSGIEFGLISATAQGQTFLNHNGQYSFQVDYSGTSSTWQSVGSSTTFIPIGSVITTSGTYPFWFSASMQTSQTVGWEETVTGTITVQ